MGIICPLLVGRELADLLNIGGTSGSLAPPSSGITVYSIFFIILWIFNSDFYSRSRQLKTATTRSVVSAMEATTGNGLGSHPATTSNAAAATSPYTVAAERAVSERGLNRAETASIGNGSHMPRHRPM